MVSLPPAPNELLLRTSGLQHPDPSIHQFTPTGVRLARGSRGAPSTGHGQAALQRRAKDALSLSEASAILVARGKYAS